MKRLKFTKTGLIVAIIATLALFVAEYFAISYLTEAFRNPEQIEQFMEGNIDSISSALATGMLIAPFAAPAAVIFVIISKFIHSPILIYISKILSACVFLIIWFGTLTVTTSMNLAQGENGFILMSIPFWIAGLLIFINQFKRTEYV